MKDFPEASNAKFMNELIVGILVVNPRLTTKWFLTESNMKNQKHPNNNRRGKKISQKLANLGAISQEKDSLDLCTNCMAELTQTDYDSGYCTQCKTRILMSLPGHMECTLEERNYLP